MSIRIKLYPSDKSRTVFYSFDELGITEEDWNSMDANEQSKLVQEAADSIYEQPYWVVDNFENTGE